MYTIVCIVESILQHSFYQMTATRVLSTGGGGGRGEEGALLLID